MTEGQYKTVRTVLETSEGRNLLTEHCIEEQKNIPMYAKRDLAVIARTTVEKYPAVACKRFTAAIASGRLTQKELANAGNPAADQSNLVRILQGR
ncbi:hypothetical protein QBK99_08760 [Corticibacterium sp. UT-5YL-CI-8]|nr:hypothetical protein [Tianweitania sp. UT-5YL-CI-8]